MLERAMLAAQAWEKLNDREVCSQLTMEELLHLMLKAGFPVDEARKAANQRGWERLSAGVAM